MVKNTWSLALCATAITLASCNRGDSPRIEEIGDQEVVVGETLTLPLIATDPDGDSISFSCNAPDVADFVCSEQISLRPDGAGVFTWTPLASQVGSHFVDFKASDGKNSDTLTILIDVKSALGEGSLPIFRKPLGSGSVLDLTQKECEEFDIEIEDPDSSSITLDHQAPVIDGSSLSPASNGLTGSWSWCPRRDQADESDRWDLVLSADDGVNPPTLKDYVIVLRTRPEDCPGESPDIVHSSMDHNTIQDIAISAEVSDDVGLRGEPLLCYAFEDPGDPIDFDKMIVQPMELTDGDMMSGSWRGAIPNPVAQAGEGASAPVWYLITAGDDDKSAGAECNHQIDLPSDGSTFEITVTNGGGDGGGLCSSCSFDVQCGDTDDLCIQPGGGGDPFCGQSCSGNDCPNDYVCSADPVSSIDGASGRQCVPLSGSCGGGGGGECDDDDWEDNDTLAEAAGNSALPAGTENGLKLCPDGFGYDADWFEIDVGSSAQVSASMSGNVPPDMDLFLTDAGGVQLAKSDGLSSDESLTSQCLDPGTYYLRVTSLFDDDEVGTYSLTHSLDTGACSGGGGDCCESNGSPGCDDPGIESCVCAVDSFCCDVLWDTVCAGKVESEGCGDCGGGGGNDSCCEAHDTPGCADDALEACVCAEDSYCCNNKWDSFCVAKVDSTGCGACNPDDGDGPCCQSNGTPGCEVNSIESCVCDDDPFCCSTVWDSTCADAVETLSCGNCPG